MGMTKKYLRSEYMDAPTGMISSGQSAQRGHRVVIQGKEREAASSAKTFPGIHVRLQ